MSLVKKYSKFKLITNITKSLSDLSKSESQLIKILESAIFRHSSRIIINENIKFVICKPPFPKSLKRVVDVKKNIMIKKNKFLKIIMRFTGYIALKNLLFMSKPFKVLQTQKFKVKWANINIKSVTLRSFIFFFLFLSYFL